MMNIPMQHVTIKAPEFMETVGNAWFYIQEVQFHLRGIGASTRKNFSLLLKNYL